MTVSIKAAFKDFFSPRYNKVNILIYLILVAFFSSLPFISYCNLQSETDMLYSSSISSYIIAIISIGYFALTTHYEICNYQQVFPSLKDFPNIIITGIKTDLGCTVLLLICSLAPILISITGAIINVPIITTLIKYLNFILSLIILYFLFFPVLFTYLRTLKLKDLFNYFDNAVTFRKERRKYYHTFILKMILILIIIFLFIKIPLIIILKMIANIYFPTLPAELTNKIISNQILSFCTIFNLFLFPNLIAQTVGK